jgi:trigger factor
MSDTEKQDLDEAATASPELTDELVQEEAEEEQPKLHLEVKIDPRGACERHITVTVAREDIDRYFDKEYSELVPRAQVPGFRPGHAPRKLIEHRFRKEVGQRVKGALLADSLAQIHEEQQLSAISEPEIDLEAVEVPEEGPLCFEFDLEVRPEFDLPKWKGLKIQKPVHQFTAADVDRALDRLLTNRGRLAPYDGAAEPGDYISTNLRFEHEGRELASATEEVIRLRPTLSFRDGKIEGFDKLMGGVRGGETRQGEVQLSEDAPNVGLRGGRVAAIFEVLEVKRLEKPRLTPELLRELGGFELEADLRDAIKDALERRLEYEQRQKARQQITSVLTVAANWDLPPGLLQRQSQRELQRAMLELQRSGFSDDEIRTHENILRQNSRAATAQALKEHFILERIAEDQQIDAVEDDYEAEIKLIASQNNQSPRRVRARLEKSGAMDALRNQIIERKVIDLILEHAQFDEVPYQPEEMDIEALELTAGGGQEAEIPAAKPGGAEPATPWRPEAVRSREER